MLYTNLLHNQVEDLWDWLMHLAELVLWHNPVSRVGGEFVLIVGSCCLKTSVLAPETVKYKQ